MCVVVSRSPPRSPEFRKFLQDGFSRGERDSSLEYISLRMIGTRVGENIVASGRIQDKVTSKLYILP